MDVWVHFEEMSVSSQSVDHFPIFHFCGEPASNQNSEEAISSDERKVLAAIISIPLDKHIWDEEGLTKFSNIEM